MADDNSELKQVNRSGFPFQLKVEYAIRSSEQDHHWSIASREHPWTHPEGKSGFIDLVLKHNQHSTFRLVIECKRVKADDARQLKWLFLVEEARSDFVLRASSFEVEADIRARVWDVVEVSPPSLESEFCVLQGDEPRRPLLEAVARELLEATEGLAQEEINTARSIQENQKNLNVRLFLFPMIVTNAKIAVCRFDPERVHLERGILEAKDADFFEVPMIRFRKSLATRFPEGVFYQLEAANRARERTVCVVNAEHLTDVLKDWNVDRMPDSLYAIERLLKEYSQR